MLYSDNHQITFTNSNTLEIVDTCQRGLEGHKAAKRERVASSDIIPIIHGTPFGDLITVTAVRLTL
jgi:hypothetical protein